MVGEKLTVCWDDLVVTQIKDKAGYTVAEASIAEKAITFPKKVVKERIVAGCVQHTKLIENMSGLIQKGIVNEDWPRISEQTQRIMMALHESGKKNSAWTKTSSTSQDCRFFDTWLGRAAPTC